MTSILEAIHGRQSIRAFLRDKPVSNEKLTRILEAGARAPNGSNIQPWRVHALTGAALATFTDALAARSLGGDIGPRDYAYYMDAWRDPYLGRRRATGWGLYGHLGIAKGDKPAMAEQQSRNYRFFDAPVGLIISMDRDMGQGAWLDIGAFIQTILLAARGEGLEACPIAAFCNYPNEIRDLLQLETNPLIMTGLAIGYPDPTQIVNTYRTPRQPVSAFTTFLDTLPGAQIADAVNKPNRVPETAS